MKKILPLLLATFFLAGCSTLLQLGSDSSNKQIESEEMTASDLFAEVKGKEDSIQSASQVSVVEIGVTMDGDRQVESKYMEQDVDIENGGLEQYSKNENNYQEVSHYRLFYANDESYFYDYDTERWAENPGEVASIKEMIENIEFTGHLNQFDDYHDHFSVYEDGDAYILSLNVPEGDEALAFLKEMEHDISYLIDPDQQNLTLDHYKFDFTIDRDSYYIQKVESEIKFTFDDEDIEYEENRDVTYTNYNEVEPIEIPDEAKE